MKFSAAEQRRLEKLLDDLAKAVEELLLSGLTTASDATRQTLNVAFQEASRMRLLRLSSTLRVANEELGRFTRNDENFSSSRLSFFLNRSWLLSHGLARALKQKDQSTFGELLWTPPNTPVKQLEVVTLGVSKRITSSFCAFEFRLRTTKKAEKLPAGQRLMWSCVFPVKPGVQVPAEGYLHLPQRQKFTAALFLEPKPIVIKKVNVALDRYGGGRVMLTEDSTVTQGKKFDAWQSFHAWDAEAALQKLRDHQPGPLDLDNELHEEVVWKDWQLDEPVDGSKEGQVVYPLAADGLSCDAVVSAALEGKALRKNLDELRKKKRHRLPLFGLLHYEPCRLVFKPLSALAEKGPEHLMISEETVDRAALLKTLQF